MPNTIPVLIIRLPLSTGGLSAPFVISRATPNFQEVYDSSLDYEMTRERWQPPAALHAGEVNRTRWQDKVPFIGQVFRQFNLENEVGVPPYLRKRESHPPQTTHGPIAFMALKVFEQLGIVSSLPDRHMQLHTAFQNISGIASDKFRQLEQTGCIPGDCIRSNGIGATGPSIGPLNNTVYSAIFIKHLVFMGVNGSIQILRLPTHTELADILRNEPRALAKAIDIQPLDTHPKRLRSQQELLDLLEATGRGEHPERFCKMYGSGDVHDIVRYVVLDYPRHVAEGRMQVVMEQPGADGKHVWETTRLPALFA